MKTADESFVKSLADSRTSSKADFESKKTATLTQTTTTGSETEKKVLTDSKTLKDGTNNVIHDFFKTMDDSIFAEEIKQFDSLKGSILSLNTEIESYEKKFNEDSQKWI